MKLRFDLQNKKELFNFNTLVVLILDGSFFIVYKTAILFWTDIFIDEKFLTPRKMTYLCGFLQVLKKP